MTSIVIRFSGNKWCHPQIKTKTNTIRLMSVNGWRKTWKRLNIFSSVCFSRHIKVYQDLLFFFSFFLHGWLVKTLNKTWFSLGPWPAVWYPTYVEPHWMTNNEFGKVTDGLNAELSNAGVKLTSTEFCRLRPTFASHFFASCFPSKGTIWGNVTNNIFLWTYHPLPFTDNYFPKLQG